MDRQRIVFDVITHVWQQAKPVIGKMPLDDAGWAGFVKDQGELGIYIRERYGDNACQLASKIMVAINEYLLREAQGSNEQKSCVRGQLSGMP